MKRDTRKNCKKIVGKEYFRFDYDVELKGYKFLCNKNVDKKSFDSLKNDDRYYSYDKWKTDILERYQKDSKKFLINFSRYLNQCIRDKEPSRKSWDILAAAILALFLENGFEYIFMKVSEISISNAIEDLIILSVSIISVCFAMGIIFKGIISPYFDDNIEKNFLNDYKEIIDKLIEDK